MDVHPDDVAIGGHQAAVALLHVVGVPPVNLAPRVATVLERHSKRVAGQVVAASVRRCVIPVDGVAADGAVMLMVWVTDRRPPLVRVVVGDAFDADVVAGGGGTARALPLLCVAVAVC